MTCPHGADLVTGDCDPCEDSERAKLVAPDADLILWAVCEAFGRTLAELRGPNRERANTRARHAAALLLSVVGGLSSTKAGAALGGRDHATILHSRHRALMLMEHDDDYRDRVWSACNRCGAAVPGSWDFVPRAPIAPRAIVHERDHDDREMGCRGTCLTVTLHGHRGGDRWRCVACEQERTNGKRVRS